MLEFIKCGQHLIDTRNDLVHFTVDKCELWQVAAYSPVAGTNYDLCARRLRTDNAGYFVVHTQN